MKKAIADFQRETQDMIDILSQRKELKNLIELKEEIDIIDNLNISNELKEELRKNAVNKKLLSDKNEIAYYEAMQSLFDSVRHLEDIVSKDSDLNSSKCMRDAYNAAVRVGYFLRSRKDYLNSEMKEKIEGNIVILNKKDFQYEIWEFQMNKKVNFIFELPRICSALLGLFNSVIYNEEDSKLYFSKDHKKV